MQSYIESSIKQFRYYKKLAESTVEQLRDEELFTAVHLFESSQQNNSIAIIMQHMYQNMLSRWTNVFVEDGEKPWRNRDAEFQAPQLTRETLLQEWENGWNCLFEVLENVTESDLERIVYIRNMGHTLVEAINRQMMHYAYHVGQIVILGKLYKGDAWKSLSIPLGSSQIYNSEKFNQKKARKHFTDDENNSEQT